jgi:hypothetical protein
MIFDDQDPQFLLAHTTLGGRNLTKKTTLGSRSSTLRRRASISLFAGKILFRYASATS